MNEIILSLIIKKGKVFLIKRKHPPFAGFWSFPGGAKELDESLETTAIRETKEETGLDIKMVRKLDNFIGLGDNGREANLHIFLCETDSSEYDIDEKECLGGGWFNLGGACQKMQLIPILKRYLQHK